MDDIVPGVLQRLREADVIGLAGLAGASLGQEYCRRGFVSTTRRQDIRLSGVVTLPEALADAEVVQAESEPLEEEESSEDASAATWRFEVAVEVLSRASCQVVCTCGKREALICTHAAALLYQWINHSHTFISLPSPTTELNGDDPGEPQKTAPVSKHPMAHADPPARNPAPSTTLKSPFPRRHQKVNTVSETLAQFGLSELRGVAREYGIALNGLGKQQLIETLIETLSQPEAIRRVVGTLEKPQRQLLAAFALAGGSMSDEDLRGLFERFSLNTGGALQDMLVALQARLLIVRTSFNHSLQQRFNLHLAPMDLSWYIPLEVREALHATLPITPFNVEVPYGKGPHPSLPTLYLADRDKLLADLLLIARALDGLPVEESEKRVQRGASAFSGGRTAADGSLALPSPADQPDPALIEALSATLERTPAFLRFTVRLLRLADLLTKEESWQTKLRAAPNAARFLLGPARDETLLDLFTRWLAQPSYAELSELAENGLRVRCRATPLNQPDLRRGELEQENSEARQDLLALLAQVPVGEWTNFSAFARFLYRLRPTLLQRRQRLFPAPHWWFEQEEGRPLHPTQLADWLKAEGRYLAHLIQGPLHWWGLCDLARSVNGQLLAFRLTPTARYLFHSQPLASHEQVLADVRETSLAVSPDGCLLVPCRPENWQLVACVEEFAECKGVQNEKLLYCLSAHSLSAAIGQGRDPRALLTLLERFATLDGGQALRQLLTSLERRIANYGRARLYTDVPLLQTADLTVMQQLTAITSLDQQVVLPIHPTLLLLKKPGVERLLEELKKRGQTPLLHETGEERWK